MNTKIINFNGKQFEYVNAIEIKELNAKYLIGKFVGTNNSRILSFINDGVNYVVDSGKLTDVEKDVLNRYFAFADGIEKFKQALASGEIISLYHTMPDVIDALYEDVSLRTIELKEETPVIEKVEEPVNEEVKAEEVITEDVKIEEPISETVDTVITEEIKPVVIGSANVEISEPSTISKEMNKISFEKLDSLMSGLQVEIDRYYDLINSLVNNG